MQGRQNDGGKTGGEAGCDCFCQIKEIAQEEQGLKNCSSVHWGGGGRQKTQEEKRGKWGNPKGASCSMTAWLGTVISRLNQSFKQGGSKNTVLLQ